MVEHEERMVKASGGQRIRVTYLCYLLSGAIHVTLKARILAMLQQIQKKSYVKSNRIKHTDILRTLYVLHRFFSDVTQTAIHQVLTVFDDVLADLPKDHRTLSKIVLQFLLMGFYHGKWVQSTVSQLALHGYMKIKSAAIILKRTFGDNQDPTRGTFPPHVVHAARSVIVSSNIDQFWSCSDLLFVLHVCPLPYIHSWAPNRVFDLLKALKQSSGPVLPIHMKNIWKVIAGRCLEGAQMRYFLLITRTMITLYLQRSLTCQTVSLSLYS
eukprot:PhF_6_TR41485/c0_g1_i1/m.62884